MVTRERHVLEESVITIAEQARRADDLVDLAATSEREDVIWHAKVLRLELLKVKADLERELARGRTADPAGSASHWSPGSAIGREMSSRGAGAARGAGCCIEALADGTRQ